MRIVQGYSWARVRFAAMAVVTAVLMIGCSTDSPVAPNTTPGASANLGIASVQQQASVIVEPPVRQRFGPIIIDAVSPIRVGTPVSLEVSADVNIPTAHAHAELEVPEIAEIAYRSTHGMQSRARRNPGVQLFWRGAAQKGQRQIRQRVVSSFP